ncbi:hypothetical protein GSI_01566 [Ganoderma sinense ZZ0214-1]|uniref:DUF6697 domain-containing protein n=1 Tax=Ganoderma sinense ZZ0214-1 TaxID=1077348 RepID=A0A2G8SQ65_9APHY|nr:hypothetical protein GSI_01566 [Ganoderma sinense ZZ0214-1]
MSPLQSPSGDDPASASFLREYYEDRCATLSAEKVRLEAETALLRRRYQEEIDRPKSENDRLKSAYDRLKRTHDELKGGHQELQGKHDALRDENASLRRQLELRSEAGQSRTPSRAPTSERGIGLRTPPPSSKGASPPLNARRACATGASRSPQEGDGESSSEDENLADFARRIRARGGRVGPAQRQEQRLRQWGAGLGGPHPIRWGPKPGAKKDKGKEVETRKRDAPDEGSDSDMPLASRSNTNRRSLSSSKRMRLEGVFPPPLPRRGHSSVPSAPPLPSGSRMARVDSSEEEDEEDESDDDEGEEEDNKDDLFSLTSLTPVSSRPSSPMPVDSADPVVPQEPATSQGPPPEGPREPETSVPIVRHFRSPSRELSYFDPIPQRRVPTPSPAQAPPTQPVAREPQVGMPQSVFRPPLPTGPPAVPSDTDASSPIRKDSWSFTDRAMADLAADPPDLHPFSVAAHSQPSPLRRFSFPLAQPSTSGLAPASRPSPLPPPPEASATPEARRPLEIARNLLRQTAQQEKAVSTSSGPESRFLASSSPVTAPSRTTALPVNPHRTIRPPTPSVPRPNVTVPMPPVSSLTTTGPGTGMTAPQAPSTTAPTSQPEGPIPPPPASVTPLLSTTPPSTAPPLTTSLSVTAPAPTSIPPSTTVHPCLLPTAALNRESQAPSVSLPSTTPPAPAEASPSQPSRGCLGHRTTTQLRPGILTRLGPPLLHQDALTTRLPEAAYPIENVNPDLLNMAFSRDFLSQTFGGSSKRKCTVCRDGRSLLFGNPTFDSHLPLCPGFSGLLFHASCVPDWKPGPNSLFIETKTAQHWYVGNYKLEETAALTKEEYAAWPVEIKRKWAGDIMNKRKHRDVRVGIVLRRRLGREPDEVDLSNAVSDGDDYKDVSRDEIIQAYEQGHQTMSVFSLTCVGYDDGFMKDAEARLHAYLARRAEHQVVQERAPASEAARSA